MAPRGKKASTKTARRSGGGAKAPARRKARTVGAPRTGGARGGGARGSGDAQTLETLSAVPLFADLNRAHLGKVARVTDLIEVPAGREIVRENTFREPGGPSFFLIVDGRAEVQARGRKVARFNPGDSFGEMSLLDGKPRSATVRALTDMKLYRIRSWHFQKLVKSEPAIAMAVIRTLAERLRAMEETAARAR